MKIVKHCPYCNEIFSNEYTWCVSCGHELKNAKVEGLRIVEVEE